MIAQIDDSKFDDDPSRNDKDRWVRSDRTESLVLSRRFRRSKNCQGSCWSCIGSTVSDHGGLLDCEQSQTPLASPRAMGDRCSRSNGQSLLQLVPSGR